MNLKNYPSPVISSIAFIENFFNIFSQFNENIVIIPNLFPIFLVKTPLFFHLY